MSAIQDPVSRRDSRSATAGEMEATIIGLQGIFWALNMLVVHNVADGIAHETDRRDGIAALIVAGERLADEISNRF
jgi:hypothetical protein